MDIQKLKNRLQIKRRDILTDVEQKIIDIEVKRLEMIVNFKKSYFTKQIWIHVSMLILIGSTFYSAINFLPSLKLPEFQLILHVVVLFTAGLLATGLLLL